MLRGVWFLRIVCGCRIFTLRLIDGTAADGLLNFIVEIFREQKIAGRGITHEDSAFVERLRVLNVVAHVSVPRGYLRRQHAAKTVDEVVGVDRIAVGPAAVMTQI